MARLEVKIDGEQVRKLASIGCTTVEIGAVLGCCSKTLDRRFQQQMKNGKQQMNASLRRKQYEVAMKGNCSMLIWLGKQYLKQRDNHDLTAALDIKKRFSKEEKVERAKVFREILSDYIG